MSSCCTIPCRPLTARTDYCTNDRLAIHNFLTTLGNFSEGLKIIIITGKKTLLIPSPVQLIVDIRAEKLRSHKVRSSLGIRRYH